MLSDKKLGILSWWGIGAILLVSGLMTGSWYQKQHGTVLANKTLTEEWEALNGKNELLVEDIETAKHKLAECARKIADPAKRNVSDMHLYIMARYSKVPRELAALIAQKTNEITDKHDVDFALVVGLMDVESAYNPFAVSKKDARGLMQVMFKYWGKQYNIKKASDLHDITLNIETGVKVLKHYIDKNEGSISKALTAYNGGGKDYAKDVFVAIGRFTAYRNNTYQKDEPEEKEKEDVNGRSLSTGHTDVPKGVEKTS